MAAETIDMTTGGTGGKLPNFIKAGVYKVNLDYADLLAAKGSALESGDIAQVFTIPAGCVAEAANLSPVTDKAINALCTTLTLDLGDATNDDMFVDGFDGGGTTEGVPIMTVEKFYPAADTLDVTLEVVTGTLVSGQVQVAVKIYELTI